jgi:hypothetical protein
MKKKNSKNSKKWITRTIFKNYVEIDAPPNSLIDSIVSPKVKTMEG